jgi:hypothetical protein
VRDSKYWTLGEAIAPAAVRAARLDPLASLKEE